MPKFKVVIGAATVQNEKMIVEPVDGNNDNQLEVEVEATDAGDALNQVQQRLQTLLGSAP